MKIKNFSFIALIIASLMILPNCAKYKPTPLPHPAGSVEESEGVKIVTRKLSEKESQSCFDSKDVPKKYEVVQIYLENKGEKSVVLSSNNINLPIASSKELSKKIYRNTAGRVAGYGIAGLFVTPFLIPAAVDGAKSSIANKKIDIDVKTKVLAQNEKEVIKPGQSVNKVIFVPRAELENNELQDNFSLTLNDKKLTKAISFECRV